MDDLDCINCIIRRRACDRSQPCCGACVRATAQCSYVWTLDASVYELFPGKILNGQFKLNISNLVHRTPAARVYKSTLSDHEVIAVKALWDNSTSGRLLQLAVREAWTWSQLDHKNIEPLLGIADFSTVFCGTLPQLCMISPWAADGNVMEYVASHPETNPLRLLLDVVNGVEYLHSLRPTKIIHGDLKGNNVLIHTACGIPYARLSDFGLSYALEEYSGEHPADSTAGSYLGNPRWLAFERMFPTTFGAMNARDAHSPSSDVFEMMRTFLEVLTGNPPFEELPDKAVFLRVMQGGNPERPSRSIPELDDTMWDLMQRAWAPRREDRPHLPEIKAVVTARLKHANERETTGAGDQDGQVRVRQVPRPAPTDLPEGAPEVGGITKSSVSTVVDHSVEWFRSWVQRSTLLSAAAHLFFTPFWGARRDRNR